MKWRSKKNKLKLKQRGRKPMSLQRLLERKRTRLKLKTTKLKSRLINAESLKQMLSKRSLPLKQT